MIIAEYLIGQTFSDFASEIIELAVKVSWSGFSFGNSYYNGDVAPGHTERNSSEIPQPLRLEISKKSGAGQVLYPDGCNGLIFYHFPTGEVKKISKAYNSRVAVENVENEAIAASGGVVVKRVYSSF